MMFLSYDAVGQLAGWGHKFDTIWSALLVVQEMGGVTYVWTFSISRLVPDTLYPCFLLNALL